MYFAFKDTFNLQHYNRANKRPFCSKVCAYLNFPKFTDFEDSATNSLKNKKIDVDFIPGGCTLYIQAPDVPWSKPFKQHCAEFL